MLNKVLTQILKVICDGHSGWKRALLVEVCMSKDGLDVVVIPNCNLVTKDLSWMVR